MLGDHVNTDVIIAAKYLVSDDRKELALHCFESIDPEIARRFLPGDLIVAGENFGCGSSREHAVLALLGLGAACVIANSYGQIFYRNAFNQGLLLIEANWSGAAVRQGDRLQVDVGGARVRNLTQQQDLLISTVPEIMMAIINAGGLIPYVLEEQRTSS